MGPSGVGEDAVEIEEYRAPFHRGILRGPRGKPACDLFGHEPTSRHGYYSHADRALVMNLATGSGTLVRTLDEEDTPTFQESGEAYVPTRRFPDPSR